MKKKISVSLDENKIRFLDELLKEERFRSKSHIIEYSLNKFIQEEKNGKGTN